jgi:hypothetical protein
LPVAWHETHRQRRFAGVTCRLGFLSSWNGHSPTRSPPCGFERHAARADDGREIRLAFDALDLVVGDHRHRAAVSKMPKRQQEKILSVVEAFVGQAKAG